MDKDKPSCFVIQEFDEGGTFDKRYVETLQPALIAAGVNPKRADQILGLKPVINKIENAIREASICVAEVSKNNPNVWLELGYAQHWIGQRLFSLINLYVINFLLIFNIDP